MRCPTSALASHTIMPVRFDRCVRLKRRRCPTSALDSLTVVPVRFNQHGRLKRGKWWWWMGGVILSMLSRLVEELLPPACLLPAPLRLCVGINLNLFLLALQFAAVPNGAHMARCPRTSRATTPRP